MVGARSQVLPVWSDVQEIYHHTIQVLNDVVRELVERSDSHVYDLLNYMYSGLRTILYSGLGTSQSK